MGNAHINVVEFVFCTLGVLIAIFFASVVWGMLDEVRGSQKISWYRRVFWRKTVEDLTDEFESGKRVQILAEEMDLAIAYSRSRLPSGLRFPKKDEIYEAREDFKVLYMTAHCAPFTGGGKAVLPKGERVKVCEPSHQKPLNVYCDPLNYDALHELIVSAEERAVETYSGYYLSISTMDLNRYFILVKENGDVG